MEKEKGKLTRRLHSLYMVGVVSFIIFFVLLFNEPEEPTFLFGFVHGITLGIPFGTVCMGAFMTSKYGAGIRAFKKRILYRG